MSSPRPNPKKNVLVDLWLASTLAVRLVEDLLTDTPLSSDEFALYGLIVDLGPVTASDLARWTGMPLTTLSNLVRRCEARGELTRVANPRDRRSSHLALSDHGMELYRRCVPRLLDALAKLHAELPASEIAVRVALQDLDTGLRAVLGAQPRPYEITSQTREHALAYGGQALTPAQRAEALAFIEWLRHRDRRP
jgi:DNA-binding MarR family transcriptional regulator